jgi:hypothetical protein
VQNAVNRPCQRLVVAKVNAPSGGTETAFPSKSIIFSPT